MSIDYLPQEMMMINTQELIGGFGSSDDVISSSGRPSRRRGRVTRSFSIVDDKLRIPEMSGRVRRPRLTNLLEKAKERCGITLMCGRSGTGKTVVAADLTSRYPNPGWYSIEPADTEWRAFAGYLVAALCGPSAVGELCSKIKDEVTASDIAEFISKCMRRADSDVDGGCGLLVLDNLHHLYDSDWFPDFFSQLILSRSARIPVLMLCRSKPPLPLWRLRSKQMLNMIDESVLGFTETETVKLCDRLGLPTEKAAQAHLRSSGRVAKLIAELDGGGDTTSKAWNIL